MKKYVGLLFALIAIAFAVGCSNPKNGTGNSDGSSSSGSSSNPSSSSGTGGSNQPKQEQYADGTYRGTYLDNGENQVTIEFVLADNKVQSIKFRGLNYKGIDYLSDTADATTKAIADQHQQLIDALVNKDINTELEKLYKPGDIAKDIEGFASATLRSGKIISAIRDALNRGVYSLPQ